MSVNGKFFHIPETCCMHKKETKLESGGLGKDFTTEFSPFLINKLSRSMVTILADLLKTRDVHIGKIGNHTRADDRIEVLCWKGHIEPKNTDKAMSKAEGEARKELNKERIYFDNNRRMVIKTEQLKTLVNVGGRGEEEIKDQDWDNEGGSLVTQNQAKNCR